MYYSCCCCKVIGPAPPHALHVKPQCHMYVRIILLLPEVHSREKLGTSTSASTSTSAKFLDTAESDSSAEQAPTVIVMADPGG